MTLSAGILLFAVDAGAVETPPRPSSLVVQCLTDAWANLRRSFGYVDDLNAGVELPSLPPPAPPEAYAGIQVESVVIPAGTPLDADGIRREQEFVSSEGYTFRTESRVTKGYDGKIVYHFNTRVEDGMGWNRGRVTREVKVSRSGKFVVKFDMAFAEPRIVTTPGGATFTVADYATLRQLKSVGVGPGNVGELVASTITNQRTILELMLSLPPEMMQTGTRTTAAELGKAIEERILSTHTSRYVQRVMGATGNEVTGATIEMYGWPRHSPDSLKDLRSMMSDKPVMKDLFERVKARLCPATDCSEIMVPKGFDIHYAVGAAASGT